MYKSSKLGSINPASVLGKSLVSMLYAATTRYFPKYSLRRKKLAVVIHSLFS